MLGYLAAGAVIGPWGFALIDNVDDILDISKFGVVLLLFLIGLELKSSKLWSLRRPIFGWCGAQVLVVAAALASAALAIGIEWRVAVRVGMAMALSSTAIVLATLGERKLMPGPAGSSSFSILLFQDIAAIPMTALVLLLAGAAGQGHSHGWQGVAKLVAVLFALVDAVRRRFPRLKILARARNVTHYYELPNRGVTLIEREIFAASLQLGSQVLEVLGFDKARAEQAAHVFREHNLKTLREVNPHFQDLDKVISMNLKARHELMRCSLEMRLHSKLRKKVRRKLEPRLDSMPAAGRVQAFWSGNEKGGQVHLLDSSFVKKLAKFYK